MVSEGFMPMMVLLKNSVVPVKVIGHKSSSTTFGIGVLLPQPLDLARIIDLVELQNSELDLLLLGLGVSFHLMLLGTTMKAKK